MPRIGNVIGGKYELTQPIGEGSMGSVWRATHQTLGRPFAVKFLKAYGADADKVEDRFVQEARLAASVQHRYVVSIVDFGLTDEGTPYMVMEFLEGESLAQRMMHAPPLGVRELLRIVAQALVGLEAVHQAGVIHRDVKPENVVLVDQAGGLIPKLVDFGISRIERRISRAGRLTAPGTAMGTPCYMAPEQVRNDRVDRRCDLYSMGVIVYEAIAGRLPYDAQDVLTLLEQVVRGGAPTLAQVRPEVGPALSAVIQRALDLDPERRFATASDMAAALLAAAGQVPEGLACPVRNLDGEPVWTGHPVADSTPLLPPEAELSEEISGPATTQKVRGRARRFSTALAGIAATATIAAIMTLRPPNAEEPVTAAPAQAAVVPLPQPRTRAPSAPAPSAPAPDRATPEPPAPPRAARATKRPRPKLSAKPRRSRPPEVFRDPGF